MRPALSIGPQCPEGNWLRRKNGCYNFGTTAGTIEDAKAACTELHSAATLVTMDDAQENNFLTHIAKEIQNAPLFYIGNIV